jgi:hypothetical protein
VGKARIDGSHSTTDAGKLNGWLLILTLANLALANAIV